MNEKQQFPLFKMHTLAIFINTPVHRIHYCIFFSTLLIITDIVIEFAMPPTFLLLTPFSPLVNFAVVSAVMNVTTLYPSLLMLLMLC